VAATRRLAAIMFTDTVGFTALGQRDESLSLALLEEQRGLLRPIFRRHSGREVKSLGDGFLVEFPSALEAVRCAYDIQRAAREFNFSRPSEQRVRLRVGVHLGDVVESQGDIAGDAVNVASRIEPLAEEGGVCVTQQVYDQVQNKFELPLASLGSKILKNVVRPLQVYKLVMPWTDEKAILSTPLRKRRIAVLPFVNISPDPNDEFFADGLTEEMIAKLSRLPGLEVIARTSIMNYKKKEKSATQIGRELGAGTLLEGSVRKAGHRIRVTVQLIDSNTEGHLWVENYERSLKDIFAVQADISERVGSALKLQLLDEDRKRIERGGTQKVEAYTLVLKGRFHSSRWELASLAEAIRYFDQAIALDPDYATAYADLATAYARLGFLESVDPKEMYRKAEQLARRALDLDESLPGAHIALADAMWNTYDFVTVERELKRALELDPSSTEAHRMLSAELRFLGRRDDSIQEAEKLLELDPLSVTSMGAAGTVYLYSKQYGKAVELLEQAVELDPKNSFYLNNLGLSHLQAGKIEEGLEEVKRAAEASTSPSYRDLAYAYVKAGRPEEARALLARLLRSSERSLAYSASIAGVYATLGEKEKALDWLERAFEERSSYLTAIGVDFVFEGLWDEPRFQSLLKKMNLR
jgi:adenylate cyclase